MNEKNEKKFETKRKQLVEYLYGKIIQSQNVKNAFLKVKRELFLPQHLQEHAYANIALPLESGQTISQPSTIAIMLELLDVKEGHKVLEVGAGCGYVAALLGELTGKDGKVYAIELLPELADSARKNLEKNNTKNAFIILGDGSEGLSEKAPFDRIIVSSACPYIPKPLFNQLNDLGRIVAPVGDTYMQRMEIMKKIKGNPMKEYYEESLFAFVPLKGKFGWK
jgi:protein-L-isoaspartate(D-aspartate) O-methyltransferase